MSGKAQVGRTPPSVCSAVGGGAPPRRPPTKLRSGEALWRLPLTSKSPAAPPAGAIHPG